MFSSSKKGSCPAKEHNPFVNAVGGPRKVASKWSQDQALFESWKDGRTGYGILQVAPSFCCLPYLLSSESGHGEFQVPSYRCQHEGALGYWFHVQPWPSGNFRHTADHQHDCALEFNAGHLFAYANRSMIFYADCLLFFGPGHGYRLANGS